MSPIQRDPFSFSDEDDDDDGTSFGYKFRIHIKAKEVRGRARLGAVGRQGGGVFGGDREGRSDEG